MFGPEGGMDQEMNRLSDKGKEKDREQGRKEWLEMGDIEGQEFSKRDMKDDDDDEEADEDEEDLEEDYEEVDDHANDDDAPRSRRSKKGMGFQLR
jgi:CD2 antigen cytoplasmic tail-binding protein 2